MSWVAYAPDMKILVEYSDGDPSGILYHNMDLLDDAEPCSDLEFLVLFGVSVDDIRRKVEIHIHHRRSRKLAR